MTEKKARSAFVPIFAIGAVLMLGAVPLLTVVPLKTCEGRLHETDAIVSLEFCECQGTGKVVVWDLWGKHRITPDNLDYVEDVP